MRRPARAVLPAALLLLAALAGCAGPGGADDGVQVGYFPNLTHAQALYAIQSGLFARAFPGQFQAVPFNAGPTALEALLTGQLDATYVGPGPLINALAATGTDVLRIVAGGASGGARFVVQGGLDAGADLRGRTFASPQLGNSQDISLKDWLRARGLATQDRGGDVHAINAQNPDILALFARGEIDGAWVPEPWATRLEMEAGGRELLDERSLWPNGRFATTLLVTTRVFLERHPDLVERLLDAHAQATAALAAGNATTLAAVNAGLKATAGKPLPDAVLAAAFAKIDFTNDPMPATLEAFGGKARGLGLLHRDLPHLPATVDLAPLNAVLARHGQPEVPPP